MLKIKLQVQFKRGPRKKRQGQDSNWMQKLKKGMVYGVGQSVGLFIGSKLPYEDIFNNLTNFF